MVSLKEFLQKLRERYLFSFLLTLLLPCVVVAAFVQSTYIRQMDDHILSAAQSRSTQIQQQVNQIFDRMRSASNSVSIDSKFQKKIFPQEYTKVVEAQNFLNILLTNQRCISNIFVLQDGSDYLLSALGTYQKSAFYTVYNPGGMPEEDFYARMKNGNGNPLAIEGAQGEYLLYSSRINRNRHSLTLLFLVDKTELRNTLRQYLTDGTGMVCIRDLEGTVLSVCTNDPNYDQAVYDEILEACQGNNELVNRDGRHYVVSHSTENAYGYEVISIITGDSLSVHAQAQNRIWFLMLFILLLAGVIMVIYLSTSMYKPIHSIKTKVEELAGDRSKPSPKSSVYETISAGIDYLERESLYMRSQIESHHQYLIGRLLNNLIQTHTDQDQLCSVFGWDRQRDVFCVCLVQVLPGYSREELVTWLQTVQMRQVRFLAKEMSQEGLFTVIWIADRQHYSAIDEQLELVRAGDSNIRSISCSGQWCGLEEIPEAFIKAIVTHTDPSAPLPEEGCRRLRHLITSLSWAKAATALEALLPQLEETAQIRYACLSATLALPEDQETLHRDIFELAKHTDLPYFREYLDSILAFLRYSAQKHEKHEDLDVPLITKMLRYLANKYNDPTFSVQEMADEFNMSMPGLSKYFHEKQGKLLNEYVTELKMNRAMFLLENTDMSVAAISQDVGYFNPGSFGRRFRQVMGMSPLEYRRNKTESGSDGHDPNTTESD